MKKNKVVYLDKLAEYTLLGLRRYGINKYELFVEYAEPHQTSWIDHICNLPDEAFEINEDAIAVFSKKDDHLRLKDVYDLEEAFEKGAQWAIDEACKWLETALSEKQTFEGYPYVQCDYYVSKEDFIQTFRKILE